MVAEQARIFANERLHQLQVRYPWAGGYAVAPVFFVLGRRYADGGGHGSTWSAASGVGVLFFRKLGVFI